MKKTIILVLLILLPVILSSYSRLNVKKPFAWDLSELKTLRRNPLDKEAIKIIKAADEYCETKPYKVTDKQKTFAPDNHYYCSIGPYWWPDPKGGSEYINRDGYINPESKLYDSSKLFSMSNRCQMLSKAFFITRDKKYYKAFVSQLKIWFIDKETYMFPSFEYAQVIPGQNSNKGRSTGIIDAYTLNSVIESIRLVNGVKRIEKKTMTLLRRWFLDFASNSESFYGDVFSKANNNISLAYDVMLINMYLFGGNDKKAKEIVDVFNEKRIIAQIKNDGSQPSELARTNAMHYSIYNLTHIVDFCYLARYWYPNYYQEHRDRIDKAFDFLGQYIDNPRTFPYQQISGWEECQTNYYKQLNRLKSL